MTKERLTTDDGWDPDTLKVERSERPTVELSKEKLAELLRACKPSHPRTRSRKGRR